MDSRWDIPDRDLWRRTTPVAPAGVGTPRESCPSDLTLASYVDGLLPEGEIAAFEAHLVACPACLEAVMSVRALPALASSGGWTMAEARAVTTAQSLEPGAEGTSFGPSAARHRRVGGWRLARGVLAAAAMIGVSILGYQFGFSMPGLPGQVDARLVTSEASFGLLPAEGQRAPGAAFAVLQQDDEPAPSALWNRSGRQIPRDGRTGDNR